MGVREQLRRASRGRPPSSSTSTASPSSFVDTANKNLKEKERVRKEEQQRRQIDEAIAIESYKAVNPEESYQNRTVAANRVEVLKTLRERRAIQQVVQETKRQVPGMSQYGYQREETEAGVSINGVYIPPATVKKYTGGPPIRPAGPTPTGPVSYVNQPPAQVSQLPRPAPSIAEVSLNQRVLSSPSSSSLLSRGLRTTPMQESKVLRPSSIMVSPSTYSPISRGGGGVASTPKAAPSSPISQVFGSIVGYGQKAAKPLQGVVASAYVTGQRQLFPLKALYATEMVTTQKTGKAQAVVGATGIAGVTLIGTMGAATPFVGPFLGAVAGTAAGYGTGITSGKVLYSLSAPKAERAVTESSAGQKATVAYVDAVRGEYPVFSMRALSDPLKTIQAQTFPVTMQRIGRPAAIKSFMEQGYSRADAEAAAGQVQAGLRYKNPLEFGLNSVTSISAELGLGLTIAKSSAKIAAKSGLGTAAKYAFTQSWKYIPFIANEGTFQILQSRTVYDYPRVKGFFDTKETEKYYEEASITPTLVFGSQPLPKSLTGVKPSVQSFEYKPAGFREREVTRPGVLNTYVLPQVYSLPANLVISVLPTAVAVGAEAVVKPAARSAARVGARALNYAAYASDLTEPVGDFFADLSLKVGSQPYRRTFLRPGITVLSNTGTSTRTQTNARPVSLVPVMQGSAFTNTNNRVQNMAATQQSTSMSNAFAYIRSNNNAFSNSNVYTMVQTPGIPIPGPVGEIIGGGGQTNTNTNTNTEVNTNTYIESLVQVPVFTPQAKTALFPFLPRLENFGGGGYGGFGRKGRRTYYSELSLLATPKRYKLLAPDIRGPSNNRMSKKKRRKEKLAESRSLFSRQVRNNINWRR